MILTLQLLSEREDEEKRKEVEKEAAKQWEVAMSYLYTIAGLLLIFGIHGVFFYIVGALAISVSDRTFAVFVKSSKLVTLGLLLFVTVGGAYFWRQWWFWMVATSLSYLLVFEMDNTTSLTSINKQKKD